MRPRSAWKVTYEYYSSDSTCTTTDDTYFQTLYDLCEFESSGCGSSGDDPWGSAGGYGNGTSGTPSPTPSPFGDDGDDNHFSPTISPTSADIRAGLAHELCFDSCILNDQVGGMDATLVNGATCTVGEGVVVDGVDGYVDLSAVEIGGATSIAMWFRPSAMGRILEFGDDEFSNNIFININPVNNNIKVVVRNDLSVAATATASSSAPDGEFRHVLVIVDGAGLAIHVDGEIMAFGDAANDDGAEPVVMTRALHYLGRPIVSSGSYHWFNGTIKSLQIWNRGSTTTRLTQCTKPPRVGPTRRGHTRPRRPPPPRRRPPPGPRPCRARALRCIRAIRRRGRRRRVRLRPRILLRRLNLRQGRFLCRRSVPGDPAPTRGPSVAAGGAGSGADARPVPAPTSTPVPAPSLQDPSPRPTTSAPSVVTEPLTGTLSG